MAFVTRILYLLSIAANKYQVFSVDIHNFPQVIIPHAYHARKKFSLQYVVVIILMSMSFAYSFVKPGDRYIVVDSGGGTVDMTVHQIRLPEGHLKELYKATGR